MENQKFLYEDAFKKSIEYFGGDELAAKVFLDKYALRDNDGNILEDVPEKMHRRISKEFARIEKKKFKEPYSEDFIFSFLDKFKYIVPQGSPMYGIGNTFQTVSLSNCFVVPSPLDSYGSICKTDEYLTQISKRRGGVGCDLSNLRPEGASTQNAARSSTGIISFAERYSNTIREVGQQGRRGALMLSLSCLHPQIEEFVTAKNDDKKITGANISIRIDDEFMKAVKSDKTIKLRWPIDSDDPKITKEVNAKDLWKKIVHSAWLRAEPGILFWDNITSYSPSDCYERFKTLSTNPCGELPLPAYDSCRLLLLNLFGFIINPFTKDAKFDFEKFIEVVIIAQRLMDDLIDLELENVDKIINKIKNDPEPDDVKFTELTLWTEIKKSCIEGRRTGLGVTAVGDTLAALGIDYGSDESIKKVEKIYKTLKLAAYRSSVDMAKELGAFSCYDSKKEDECAFIKNIAKEDEILYKDMIKFGRRNISLLTTAPAGSVSIQTQTTSGIEPIFDIAPFTRRKKVNPNDKNIKVDFIDQSGDSWQEFEAFHPKLKMWMDITRETDYKKSPWYGCTANDLNWVQRVKLQAAAQKHIDNSISSTVNVPKDVSENKISEIYMAAWESGCKGITVYRDGCRSGVLVRDDAKKDKKIEKTKAPKRPEITEGEMYQFIIRSHSYFVGVGLLNGEPYEIFVGNNHNEDGEIYIPKYVKYGKIKKLARGKYCFVHLNDDKIEEKYLISNGHNDDTADALARIISTSLRHGTDISFIVHQLEKTNGPMTSFAKALARTLKKYIKDGTEVHGEVCASCKSALVRQEGCVYCRNCGWQKCS